MKDLPRLCHAIATTTLLALSTAEMALTAALMHAHRGEPLTYPVFALRTRTRFTLFISVWSVLTSLLFLTVPAGRPRSVVVGIKSASAHFCYLTILWLMWLAAAVSISRMLSGTAACVNFGGFFELPPSGSSPSDSLQSDSSPSESLGSASQLESGAMGSIGPMGAMGDPKARARAGYTDCGDFDAAGVLSPRLTAFHVLAWVNFAYTSLLLLLVLTYGLARVRVNGRKEPFPNSKRSLSLNPKKNESVSLLPSSQDVESERSAREREMERRGEGQEEEEPEPGPSAA